MYQITCDGFVLYDPRDDEFVVKSPKCKTAVNTVGEASFEIYSDHPHYDKLNKLRSIFEIKQDSDIIFRGRMTEHSEDFNNKKAVDLEGAMAFFNDSIVRPFDFPADVLNDVLYETALKYGNVVEYFLKWLVDNHNSQVQDFQKLYVGKVTVTDPNNYIARSSAEHKNTWEVLSENLLKSQLGGYLCIRYEEFGTYIDYLAEFTETNAQKIVFGENLLDRLKETDATATYSAVIPLGVKAEGGDSRLTISGLPDGNITDDIVKSGDTIYSKKAVAAYGWIYAPVADTTWDDVTEAGNLRSNGADYLQNTAARVGETITFKAFDLHLSDKDIEAFRIYKNIDVVSNPHNHSGTYPLSELEIDIENPQNTTITVGETKRTLTAQTSTTAAQIAEVQREKDALQIKVSGIDSQYKEVSAQLELKIGADDFNSSNVISMINASAEQIRLAANRLIVESDHFNLTYDGIADIDHAQIDWAVMSEAKIGSAYFSDNTEYSAPQISFLNKGIYLWDALANKNNHRYCFVWDNSDGSHMFRMRGTSGKKDESGKVVESGGLHIEGIDYDEDGLDFVAFGISLRELYNKVNELAGHSHSYTKTTTASCHSSGVATYRCACGDYYTEYETATGHQNITIIENPDEFVCKREVCLDCGVTISENGCALEWSDEYNMYICAVCGSQYPNLPFEGGGDGDDECPHLEFEEGGNRIDACHTEMWRTCAHCGKMIETWIETYHAGDILEQGNEIDSCHTEMCSYCTACNETISTWTETHHGNVNDGFYCNDCGEYVG